MKQAHNYSNNSLIIVFAMYFSCNLSVNAQTSVFQDASGESAFKVFGSAVTINTADANVSFSSDIISRNGSSNNLFNRWGVTAKLTANEGLAKLKDEDGFLVDGQLGIYHGWKTTKPIGNGATPGPGWVHEKYLSVNVDVDRNKLYDFNRPKDDVTYNKGYAGWKVELGWFGYYGNFLWGISINGGQKTNVSSINQRTISTLLQSSHKDSVIAYKQETAYSALELKHGLWFLNINSDLAVVLIKDVSKKDVGPVLLGLHLRYQALQNDRNKFNPAIGLYISKVRAPQDVVLGINAQLQDLFNVDKSDNMALQRLTLSLTAGFKLN